MTVAAPRRLVVAISGASGATYGIRTLEQLRRLNVETHLIVSKSAHVTITDETGLSLAQVRALADHWHPIGDIAAPISSGSFRTDGMIVAPCSIRSVSEIAAGISSTLLSRAADVVLKERRRLVLLVRETPLHLGHLRTLASVTEMGAIVMPPVPAFYSKPASIDDIVNHTVARALDLFGLDTGGLRRWTGLGGSETQ